MVSLVAAGLVGVIAGVWDARTGRIPNRLTVGALIAALAVRGALEGRSGMASAALGLLLVSLVPVLLFTFSRGRGIGGGDVKVFAALGAWLGPVVGVEAQFLSFVCLTFAVLVLATWRGRLLEVLAGALELSPGRWIVGRSLGRAVVGRRPRGDDRSESMERSGAALTPVRMGPAIAVGTLLAAALEGAGRWT